jgi:putative transposase
MQFVLPSSLEIAVFGYGWTTKTQVKTICIHFCAVLAANFPFANELNSMARDLPAQSEHGLLFLDFMITALIAFLARKGILNSRKIVVSSTKHYLWKLADNRKSITFTDKKGIGRLKLKGKE